VIFPAGPFQPGRPEMRREYIVSHKSGQWGIFMLVETTLTREYTLTKILLLQFKGCTYGQ
jgi:hypothetical protein